MTDYNNFIQYLKIVSSVTLIVTAKQTQRFLSKLIQPEKKIHGSFGDKEL